VTRRRTARGVCRAGTSRRGPGPRRFDGVVARGLAAALSLLAAACLPRHAAAQDDPEPVLLWQIGYFDESSSEFARPADYSRDPVFVVGKSAPAVDWYAFHPGSANARAGHREHRHTIQFDLERDPVERYVLRVSLLLYSPRLPALGVEINGRRGRFYPYPSLAYSAGDPAVFYLPHYSKAMLELDIPTEFLVRGSNDLVLTAIDEKAESDATQPNGFPWPGPSGLVYDALALEERPTGGKPVPRGFRPYLFPQVFYTERGGQLFESVQVLVRFNQPMGETRVQLITGGQSIQATTVIDSDFGDARLELEVPELPPQSSVTVVVAGASGSRGFPLRLSPARKWNLLVVPHEHIDVGYTDYDAKVAELHSRVLDEALDLAARVPDFRFTVDGFWTVEQFLRGRSPERVARLAEAVKAGQILIPANYASQLTGFASLESLQRGLYPSHRYLQSLGVAMDHALITDVPSCSWSYASILAASGVTSFAIASDAYRAPFLLYNRFHEHSPQLWEGPDGRRIRVWYSRHYHQLSSLFGMPPSLQSGVESLPRFLQAYDRKDYLSDAVILQGSQVENTALEEAQAGLVQAWNSAHAYPKLRFVGLREALDEVARPFGGSLPVVRGDGGTYWEDGVAANARVAAVGMGNARRMLTAEKLAALSALVSTDVAPDRAAFAEAWRDILLTDEHTWHAAWSVTDPDSDQSRKQGAVKDSRADEAERLIDHAVGRGLSALAASLPSPRGTLVLFNPLSFPRRALVETEIGKGLELIDPEGGQVVAADTLVESATYRRIRFFAPEVPSVGCRSFVLRPAPARAAEPSAPSTQLREEPRTQLESPFYRVVLDPASGAVASLFDKELGRELIDTASPYKLGQVIYVTGADRLPNRLVQYSTVAPPPELELHPARGAEGGASAAQPASGARSMVTKTTWGSLGRVESTAPNLPKITTEVLVFDAEKRVDLRVRLEKTRVTTKEAVYIAFPFAVGSPRFRYATQSGVVDPSRDLLPGACLEWFCAHGWVAVDGADATCAVAPIKAPLITLGDIARGVWPKAWRDRPGTVFSYVMSNYTPEGYSASQGGSFLFRYSISSGNSLPSGALSRFAAAAAVPLEVDEVTKNDRPASAREGPGAATRRSFLELTPADVQLVTWKPAEAGSGTVLRLLETGGRAAAARLRFPGFRIDAAALANGLEEPVRPLEARGDAIEVDIRPYEVLTLRIALSRVP